MTWDGEGWRGEERLVKDGADRWEEKEMRKEVGDRRMEWDVIGDKERSDEMERRDIKQ